MSGFQNLITQAFEKWLVIVMALVWGVIMGRYSGKFAQDTYLPVVIGRI